MVTSLESLESTIASEESSLQELKGQLQQVQGTTCSYVYVGCDLWVGAVFTKIRDSLAAEFGDNSSHKYNQFLSSTADRLQASQVSPLPTLLTPNPNPNPDPFTPTAPPQDQLSQLLSHNSHLANCYTQQQKVCLRQKAQAVVILDASADDEATNQDYHQVCRDVGSNTKCSQPNLDMLSYTVCLCVCVSVCAAPVCAG